MCIRQTITDKIISLLETGVNHPSGALQAAADGSIKCGQTGRNSIPQSLVGQSDVRNRQQRYAGWVDHKRVPGDAHAAQGGQCVR
jgi:hypothetical protein